MGFFSRLFSQGKSGEEIVTANQTGSQTDSVKPIESIAPVVSNAPTTLVDDYTRVGLACEISDEDREIVSVIASSIMAGDNLNTQVKVKTVVGIDEGKEAAAVIAAAIAAKDYPDSVFRLVSVKEIN